MKKHLLLIILSVFFSTTMYAESASDYVTPIGACYRHGYNQLTANEKRMYEYMLSQFLVFEANADDYQDIVHRVYFDFYSQGISFTDPNDVTRMLTILNRDIPELYIMYMTILRYDYSNYMYYGRVVKQSTPESYLSELKQCAAAYDSISKNITPEMNEYDKALILHDKFIDWADYGGMTNPDASNIKGSFINKKAVCEGFARAYLYLCQRAGLNCIYVTGQLKTSDSPETWGNHAWNYVQIDGVWYLVDITADGGFPGVCGHVAFLKGKDYYNANYKVTYVDGSNGNVNTTSYKSIPEISDVDYSFPTSLSNQTDEKKQIVGIYNIEGQRIDALQKGVNIIRYSDGSAEKVLR